MNKRPNTRILRLVACLVLAMACCLTVVSAQAATYLDAHPQIFRYLTQDYYTENCPATFELTGFGNALSGNKITISKSALASVNPRITITPYPCGAAQIATDYRVPSPSSEETARLTMESGQFAADNLSMYDYFELDGPSNSASSDPNL